jgi:hypothetical protein
LAIAEAGREANLFCIALIALLASAAFAEGFDPPRVDSKGVHINNSRAKALRECSTLARQVPEYIYEENDLSIYRACMNDHREVE